ncbi:MAG: class II aldolase/adducin family protein, partial [Gemmatimonadaceae bacterium]|nr:class II aldolase/adducin family protein [Gemmatimonadaceae bacterium]
AEGNCSVRLRDGTLLVTPSGADKASLTAPQVLRRHADGTEYHNGGTATVTSDTSSGDSPPRPSSELQMHLGIYGSRADVMAVVHAHPPVATGFATAGRTIPADVLPEVPVVLGPVALVPYGRRAPRPCSTPCFPSSPTMTCFCSAITE